MIIAMTGFSLMLLDVITPRQITFGKLRSHSGLFSDFASGFMAAILATPCSAPLVGTAVSFALAAPLINMIIIMISMGFGLALPWLILALFPSLVIKLPKPGRWLSYVKPIMAIALLGTVLWLSYLLWGNAGGLSVGILLASLTVAIFLLYFINKKMIRSISVSFVILIGFIGSMFFASTYNQGRTIIALDDGTGWQNWTIARLDSAIADNQPVFVDVTADWCITCQVNKKFVLERDDVIAAFDKYDVIRLRADWTLPDQDIADYLLSFGRFGIPFNVLYFPDQRQPLIFSELLSAKEIISALDENL